LNDDLLLIYQQRLRHFMSRCQQDYGLNLLRLAFRDILYCHIGKEDNAVVFAKDDGKIENLVMFFSQEKLLDILNKLLDAKRKLRQNVNPTLVMEQLTIQIQG